jgi:hypothetical protein
MEMYYITYHDCGQPLSKFDFLRGPPKVHAASHTKGSALRRENNIETISSAVTVSSMPETWERGQQQAFTPHYYHGK